MVNSRKNVQVIMFNCDDAIYQGTSLLWVACIMLRLLIFLQDADDAFNRYVQDSVLKKIRCRVYKFVLVIL